MLTGKNFGKLTVRHGAHDHRCEWTLLNDRSLLVMVWISDKHVARKWTFPLPPDANLNDTAQEIAIGILSPEA